MLARGAHGDKESFNVWAPEGTWHYNIEGRSATDSNDQARKKLNLAERRILRAGPKSILTGIDIGFVNGWTMKRMLQPASMDRKNLDRLYTKVNFMLDYASEVLSSVKPMRRRVTAAHHEAMASPQTGVRAHRVVGEKHKLVDMGKVAMAETQEKMKKRKRDVKRVSRCSGKCAFDRCPGAPLPKRSQLRCDKCEKYFHLPCFFECHECSL